MRIEINGIDRECQVIQASRGSYAIYDIDEGLFGFPQFVVLAPAITEEEKKCGNIITCPVDCCNGGIELADMCEIKDWISVDIFKTLVKCHHITHISKTKATAEYFYDQFQFHGTYITKELRDYMSKKDYLTDKDLLEFDKE